MNISFFPPLSLSLFLSLSLSLSTSHFTLLSSFCSHTTTAGDLLRWEHHLTLNQEKLRRHGLHKGEPYCAHGTLLPALGTRAIDAAMRAAAAEEEALGGDVRVEQVAGAADGDDADDAPFHMVEKDEVRADVHDAHSSEDDDDESETVADADDAELPEEDSSQHAKVRVSLEVDDLADGSSTAVVVGPPPGRAYPRARVSDLFFDMFKIFV